LSAEVLAVYFGNFVDQQDSSQPNYQNVKTNLRCDMYVGTLPAGGVEEVVFTFEPVYAESYALTWSLGCHFHKFVKSSYSI
jgi:hypothetical protein